MLIGGRFLFQAESLGNSVGARLGNLTGRGWSRPVLSQKFAKYVHTGSQARGRPRGPGEVAWKYLNQAPEAKAAVFEPATLRIKHTY